MEHILGTLHDGDGRLATLAAEPEADGRIAIRLSPEDDPSDAFVLLVDAARVRGLLAALAPPPLVAVPASAGPPVVVDLTALAADADVGLRELGALALELDCALGHVAYERHLRIELAAADHALRLLDDHARRHDRGSSAREAAYALHRRISRLT